MESRGSFFPLSLKIAAEFPSSSVCMSEIMIHSHRENDGRATHVFASPIPPIKLGAKNNPLDIPRGILSNARFP